MPLPPTGVYTGIYNNMYIIHFQELCIPTYTRTHTHACVICTHGAYIWSWIMHSCPQTLAHVAPAYTARPNLLAIRVRVDTS